MTSRCGVFSRRSTGALVSDGPPQVELGKDESIAIMFSVIAAASVIVHFVLGDKPGGPKTGRFFADPRITFPKSRLKTIRCHTMRFWESRRVLGFKNSKIGFPILYETEESSIGVGEGSDRHCQPRRHPQTSPDTPWPLFSAPPAFPAPSPRRCSRPAGTRSPSSAPPAASASPAACS